MFDIPADSLPDEGDRNPDEPDKDVRMNQTDIDNDKNENEV